jgi:uncharacterized integral membrane protein
MRFGRRRSEEEPRGATSGGPVRLLVLVATVAYATAFALENRKKVGVNFVFGTARVSLIWLILLSIALGVLGRALLPALYRRRHRRH